MDALESLKRHMRLLEDHFDREEIEAAVTSCAAIVMGNKSHEKPTIWHDRPLAEAPARAAVEKRLRRLERRYPDLNTELFRLARSIAGHRPRSNTRVLSMRRCEWCGEQMPAKVARIHRSRCPKRPRLRAPGAGRPAVLVACRWCHRWMPTQERKVHEPDCYKNRPRKS